MDLALKYRSVSISGIVYATCPQKQLIPSWIQTQVVPSWTQTQVVPSWTETQVVPSWIQTQVVPSRIQTPVVPSWIQTQVVPSWTQTQVVSKSYAPWAFKFRIIPEFESKLRYCSWEKTKMQGLGSTSSWDKKDRNLATIYRKISGFLVSVFFVPTWSWPQILNCCFSQEQYRSLFSNSGMIPNLKAHGA